ncbi:MAG: hypothetical protein ACRD4B_02255, partial [Acidobacteriota bacterium]
VVGGYASGGAGRTVLVRLNAKGKVVWSKRLRVGMITGLVVRKDGFILQAGTALVKVNLSGDVVWSKSFGDFLQPFLSHSVIKLKNGYLFTLENIRKAIYLVSIDNNGEFRWAKQYRTSGCSGKREVPEVLVKSLDGGSLLVLNSECTPGHLRVMKLGSKGEIVWQRAYDMRGYWSVKALATTDDGYLLGVNAKNVNLFIKLDASGSEQWQKSYSAVNPFLGLRTIQEQNGRYVVLANNSVYEMNGKGNILRGIEITPDVPSYDPRPTLVDLYSTDDGGFSVTGYQWCSNRTISNWIGDNFSQSSLVEIIDTRRFRVLSSAPLIVIVLLIRELL